MSTLVNYLIADAAQTIGDPNKQRVTSDQWLLFYNQALRKLCEKANVLRLRSLFSLEADADYTYPPEMTVMTGMEVTDTPGDPDSWRECKEMFEDEFRERVSSRYPNATLPTHYFATSGWFSLIPRPTAEIIYGARITYFGLPVRVVDLTTALLETPDFTQDYVSRRMVISADEARNRLVEAKAALELWEAEVQGLQDKFDDRSQDRPSTIAPRRNRFAGMS